MITVVCRMLGGLQEVAALATGEVTVGMGREVGAAPVRDAIVAESLALESVRAVTVAVSLALASISCAMVVLSVVEVAAMASR